MTSLRLPLRLARRDVWRRPGRTAMVALLVAMPVAAMTFAVVLIRTDRNTTPLEDWGRRYGQADAVRWEGGGRPEIRTGEVQVPEGYVRPDPPAGSRVVEVSRIDYQRIRTAEDHRADVSFSDLPLLDPITVGIHDLVAGRSPARSGEIVLARELADRLDVGVGDDLVLDRPAKLTFHVVGLIEPVGCLSCPDALVPPRDPVLRRLSDIPGSTIELVDLPEGLTIAEERALLESGAADEVRDLVTDPSVPEAAYTATQDDATPIRWTLVLGALVLTVAGIVISAAFAVGARRQLVTLGQLSATGAPPSVVRLALVLEGTVTGVVGATVGLGIATFALAFGESRVEDILDERIPGYVVRLSDILLVLAIGIGAATIAALIPARTAATIPTLAALAGRRPLSPVPGRIIARGAAAFAGGLALLGIAVVGGSNATGDGDLWAYVAIAGGVAELLGACAVAPAVVARLEPLAARLRGGLRLGARSLARNRSRTGAVVSAVAAAGALAVAASGLILGNEARSELEDVTLPADVVVASEVALPDDDTIDVQQNRPVSPALRADLLDVLPGAGELVLSATAVERPEPRVVEVPPGPTPMPVDDGFGGYWGLVGPDGVSDGGFYDRAAVVDDDILDVMGAPDDVRQALADGLVVVAGTAEIGGADGRLQVQLPDGRQIAAVTGRTDHRLSWNAQLMISPERAEELDLRVVPSESVFVADHALTEAQRDEVEDLLYGQRERSGGYVAIDWYQPSSGPSPFELELLLSGVALLFSLFVVGLSLALAAAEGKDERDVLTVAGAPPGTLARSAGARAWLLAAIGGAMAIPVGFLPIVVFVQAETSDEWNREWPLVFPTRTALILLVVVPAVLAAVAWTASATAQRLRPVRVSTATFE